MKSAQTLQPDDPSEPLDRFGLLEALRALIKPSHCQPRHFPKIQGKRVAAVKNKRIEINETQHQEDQTEHPGSSPDPCTGILLRSSGEPQITNCRKQLLLVSLHIPAGSSHVHPIFWRTDVSGLCRSPDALLMIPDPDIDELYVFILELKSVSLIKKRVRLQLKAGQILAAYMIQLLENHLKHDKKTIVPFNIRYFGLVFSNHETAQKRPIAQALAQTTRVRFTRESEVIDFPDDLYLSCDRDRDIYRIQELIEAARLWVNPQPEKDHFA